ncbi:hypothetical protein Tco_0016031 [Tanacetum coccineum]
MKTSNILRVLRIILVILPEHQSDTYVITMKMEILPVSTSNNTAADSIFQTRNPVKEILLKLNLPDHRSILTDSKILIKMERRYMVPAAGQDKSRFITACSYSTDKCKDIMKAQVHVSRLPLL